MGKKKQNTIGVAATSSFIGATSSMAASQILNHFDKESDKEMQNDDEVQSEKEEGVVDTKGEKVGVVSSQTTNVNVEDIENPTSIDAVNDTTPSDPVEPDPVEPEPVEPEPVEPDPIEPDPIEPEPVEPEPVEPEPVEPEPVDPVPIEPDLDVLIYGGPEIDDGIIDIDIIQAVYAGPIDDIDIMNNDPDIIGDNQGTDYIDDSINMYDVPIDDIGPIEDGIISDDLYC